MLKKSIRLVAARKENYQAKLVFYLFLASLGMFFIGSLLTYLIVREQAMNPHPDALPDGIMAGGPEEYASLQIPVSFWVSTALLVVVSYALQKAVWAVNRERQAKFRRCLWVALGGASLFVLIQSFGMVDLLQQHFSQDDGSMKVYGMSFTLSFIHALHVLGGMIFLGYIIVQASRNRYDHERHWAVEHCASYWHFLDVVWVCMLVTFVVTK